MEAFVLFGGRSGDVQSGTTEHGGGDVAEAVDRIAPAAIVVLMLRQPGHAPGDQGIVRRSARRVLWDQGQGADGRRRGQGRSGQFADPVAFRSSLGQKSLQSEAIRGFEAFGDQQRSHQHFLERCPSASTSGGCFIFPRAQALPGHTLPARFCLAYGWLGRQSLPDPASPDRRAGRQRSPPG